MAEAKRFFTEKDIEELLRPNDKSNADFISNLAVASLLRGREEPQDKTAKSVPQAGIGRVLPALGRKLIEAKPVSKELFKQPSFYGVVVEPYFEGIVKGEALKAAKDKITGFKRNLESNLEYMNLIPYEGLVNEAVNRHLKR